MKKVAFFSFITLLAMAFSMSLVACGSDDDEEGGGNPALVGKWIHESSRYVFGYQFNSDGTYDDGEWYKGDSEKWHRQGRWTTSGKDKLILTEIDDDEEDVDQYTYRLEDNGKTLILIDEYDDYEEIFIKQ